MKTLCLAFFLVSAKLLSADTITELSGCFYTMQSDEDGYFRCDSFETLPSEIIWDTVNNIWQIGIPHKTYLDSAWSLPKCLITDTSYQLPSNTSSSFIWYIPINSYFPGSIDSIYFSFYHKFDFEPGSYGSLEIKYANAPWYNLNDVNPYCYEPDSVYHIWQDSVHYQNNLVIQNNSNGWIKSVYNLKVGQSGLIGNYYVLFRFTVNTGKLNSDYEGWMIDNICFEAAGFPIGIGDLQDGPLIHIFPNPASEVLYIKTLQGEGSQSMDIRMVDMLGKLVLSQNMGAHGKDIFEIDVVHLPEGVYVLRVIADGKIYRQKVVVAR